jgi:hypothetical protein
LSRDSQVHAAILDNLCQVVGPSLLEANLNAVLDLALGLLLLLDASRSSDHVVGRVNTDDALEAVEFDPVKGRDAWAAPEVE